MLLLATEHTASAGRSRQADSLRPLIEIQQRVRGQHGGDFRTARQSNRRRRANAQKRIKLRRSAVAAEDKTRSAAAELLSKARKDRLPQEAELREHLGRFVNEGTATSRRVELLQRSRRRSNANIQALNVLETLGRVDLSADGSAASDSRIDEAVTLLDGVDQWGPLVNDPLVLSALGGRALVDLRAPVTQVGLRHDVKRISALVGRESEPEYKKRLHRMVGEAFRKLQQLPEDVGAKELAGLCEALVAFPYADTTSALVAVMRERGAFRDGLGLDRQFLAVMRSRAPIAVRRTAGHLLSQEYALWRKSIGPAIAGWPSEARRMLVPEYNLGLINLRYGRTDDAIKALVDRARRGSDYSRAADYMTFAPGFERFSSRYTWATLSPALKRKLKRWHKLVKDAVSRLEGSERLAALIRHNFGEQEIPRFYARKLAIVDNRLAPSASSR